MNSWLILPGLVVIALVFVVIPVGVVTFTYWRRPFRLTCPRTGTEAQMKVAATGAAVAAVLGHGAPEIERCSLWSTVRGCRAECLALPAGALRPMRRGEPPPRAPGASPTVLVPLDGSPGSEQALAVIGEWARARGAIVRLVHVVKPLEAVQADDGRVLAFADQETGRVEEWIRDYFKRLEGRLPGVTVEGAVRFGDPLTEILEEAEATGVELIAMASRRRRGLGRFMTTSLTRRLRRATLIPVLVVSYGEPIAA